MPLETALRIPSHPDRLVSIPPPTQIRHHTHQERAIRDHSIVKAAPERAQGACRHRDSTTVWCVVLQRNAIFPELFRAELKLPTTFDVEVIARCGWNTRSCPCPNVGGRGWKLGTFFPDGSYICTRGGGNGEETGGVGRWMGRADCVGRVWFSGLEVGWGRKWVWGFMWLPKGWERGDGERGWGFLGLGIDTGIGRLFVGWTRDTAQMARGLLASWDCR